MPHIPLEIYSCSPGSSSRCCDSNSSAKRQQGVSSYQSPEVKNQEIVLSQEYVLFVCDYEKYVFYLAVHL